MLGSKTFWKIMAISMAVSFVVNLFMPINWMHEKPKLIQGGDVSYVNLGNNIYEYTIKGNKYLVYDYSSEGGICPELPDKNK